MNNNTIKRHTHLYCKICWNNYCNSIKKFGYIASNIPDGCQSEYSSHCEYCNIKFIINENTLYSPPYPIN